MIRYKTAALVIAIQCLLVLTIAGKFLLERKTCPRVWARAANVDPNSPMRGRYLILPLEVNTCALQQEGDGDRSPEFRNHSGIQRVDWWSNFRLVDRGGKLTAIPVPSDAPRPGEMRIARNGADSCSRARLLGSVDFYIPDTTQWPPKLGSNDALWVEVTIPPTGPPRPIQLAVSRNGVFAPLKMN
jgi:hypothetical protein